MDTYSKRCQEGRLIANDSRGLSVDVERAIDASRATGTEQELAHTRGREVQLYAECEGYSEEERDGWLVQEYTGTTLDDEDEPIGEWRVRLVRKTA